MASTTIYLARSSPAITMRHGPRRTRHNLPESVCMTQQEGRKILKSHFDDVVKDDSNIKRTYTDQYGTFQIRRLVVQGSGGFLNFESTWQVTNDSLAMTTVIPKGG